MRWLRRRHAELDERVERARAERLLSEERLQSMREDTARPLMRRGERNQFAEIIRRSLRDGGGGGRHEGRTA